MIDNQSLLRWFATCSRKPVAGGLLPSLTPFSAAKAPGKPKNKKTIKSTTYLKDYRNQLKQGMIIKKLNIGTSIYIGIKELSMKFQSMQLNSQKQKAAEYDGDGHVLVLEGAETKKHERLLPRQII